MSPRSCLAALAAIVCVSTGSAFGQFTPGQVVALRVNGDANYNQGGAALSGSATPVFLDQFNPTASGPSTPTFTVAIPTQATANSGSGLTISGLAPSDGQITRSANGQSILIAGYDAFVSQSGVASTSTSTVTRIIAQVGSSGAVSFPVSGITVYSGSNFRSATTDTGANYWGAGGNSGTTAFPPSTSAGGGTPVQANVSNTRYVGIFNNQLYAATATNSGGITPGVYSVGSGTPTTGTTATQLIATGGTSSPYAFSVAPSGTTVYIADDRSATSGGGVQRWDFNGTSWGLSYTLALGTGSGGGARGLFVDFSGGSPTLYATTTESSANRLVTFTDLGTSFSSFTVLAAAPTNTAFRGVAFAPVPVPEPVTVLATATAGLGLAGLARRVRRAFA